MTEALIDIVATPGRPGLRRWQAVTARGRVAGTAGLRPFLPTGQELHLYVEPRWRRRGIGSRLLATVRAESPGSRLLADVAAGSAAEAFCRWHGFRRTSSRRLDLLAYCDVHRAWLGELVDAEHPGYRLVQWTGDLPDAARIEELLRSPSSPGNAVLTAADADGDLAAYAVAVVGTFADPRARQYGPVVLPDHHGRRLGIWVNAALIQRLREVHPHIDEIETVTDDGDPHLLAVRKDLGFRALRRSHLYELIGGLS
ncbi:GNAT family N-acetyltransferase [Actinoplanes sp. NBC_00393]|uniref:GNAT family N-acetyltransferase n=1 Tax=Actinoplanes sp. NBC_00393 TaxID=2975953 RepID=UPI002E236390